MERHCAASKFFRLRLLLLPGLLIVATALMPEAFETTQPAAGNAVSATYWDGTLRVSIPFRAPHPGAGKLALELLNPEDEVLARVERPVDVTAGMAHWREQLQLAKPLAIEDLVWQRLRYRFTYDGSGRAAIEGAALKPPHRRSCLCHS
jgi:hypothetical protein